MTLHTAWCAAGYDPDRFWAQTPATFASAMAGAGERLRAAGERDLAMAHATAQFTRAKKLDRLGRYLPRRRVAQGASMLDRLKSIAAATGGAVRL